MDFEAVIREMTLEEKASLCTGRDFWHTNAVERLNIHPVMMCDGPHGLRKQVDDSDHLGIHESNKAVCFPTSSALASSFDRELLREIGHTLGNECRAENIGILLGPGINIKRSPLCGRNFEFFSEDPYVTAELASAYVEGLQSRGVACCVKHFLAYNQETDRMTVDVKVDQRTLREVYMPGFESTVIDAKAQTIMCSYNKVNGTYLSENDGLLTGILRDSWGFSGFVVTDWGAVKDRVVGLRAGLELNMPGGNPLDSESIIRAVENGVLDENVLDRAIRRFLSVYCFIEKNDKTSTVFDFDADHNKSLNAAIECAVLLKNDRKLLPLRKTEKVVFVGDFARNPRYQGNGSSYVNPYLVVSALDAAADMSSVSFVCGYDSSRDDDDPVLLEQAKQAAVAAGTAVIFAGLPGKYESEGYDRKDLALPHNQNRLIEELCSVQPNTVVVLHNGSCVTMPWVDKVPAILEMYLGGEAVGAASVSLLFGDRVPGGKLAESFPHKLSDNPSFLNFPGHNNAVEYREGVYVGYRYYDTKKMDVLFPFGHGLSYTEFLYENIQLSSSRLTDVDTLGVKVDITNIGDFTAKEVVQLYVKPISGKVPRPEHELRGFDKVQLQPGGKKTVTFNLGRRAFSYYNEGLRDWHVETGDYEIQVGSSSRDIRLRAIAHIMSTVTIPLVVTPFTAIGEILKTEKGSSLLGQLVQMSGTADKQDNNAMGEASEEVSIQTGLQMPLQSLVAFGRISPAIMESIITNMNA